MKRERRVKFGKVLLFAVIFAAFVSVGCASAATHYVNPGESIQTVVNAADPGDTIIVRDGIYTENVDVNKHLTIQSENGLDSTIVHATNPDDHVFEITADYVNIRGFTVKGATVEGYPPTAGICLNDAHHCLISNNTASNNYLCISLIYSSNNTLKNNNASSNRAGIGLDKSNNNMIINNNASLNYYYGIYLVFSSNNTIENNNANSNGDNGIELGFYSNNNTIKNNNANSNGWGIELGFHSNNNIIENNNANSNRGDGIGLGNSNGNTIINNTASNNYNCIYLWDSSKNTIKNNNVSSNHIGIMLLKSSNNTINYNIAKSNEGGICLGDIEGGIYFGDSNENILTNNGVSSNNYGISLGYSSNNTIKSNNVLENEEGIILNSSNNNKIYLNNFMNNNNVYSYASTSFWNTKINYVYRGKTYINYIGNYWSDYTGNDANNDGIGDTPYGINSDKDRYPLIVSWENFKPIQGEKPTRTPKQSGFEATIVITSLLATAYFILKRKKT